MPKDSLKRNVKRVHKRRAVLSAVLSIVLVSLVGLAQLTLVTPQQPENDQPSAPDRYSAYSPTKLNYSWSDAWNGANNNPIPSSSVPHRNIIVNPSAETGDIAGWSVLGGVWSSSTAQRYYGDYSFSTSMTGTLQQVKDTGFPYDFAFTSTTILAFAVYATAVSDVDYLDVVLRVELNANMRSLHYLLKTTVLPDEYIDYYFKIGSTAGTWIYVMRNITADLCSKGEVLPWLPHALMYVNLQVVRTAGITAYFDTIYLGDDQVLTQGSNPWYNNEFEHPVIIDPGPAGYPTGWLGPEGIVGGPGDTDTYFVHNGQTSYNSYLHNWHLRIDLTAIADLSKGTFRDIGVNAPNNIAYALRLVSAGATGNVIWIRLYDMETDHQLIYEYGTGASIVIPEIAGLIQVIHEQINVGTWYYRIHNWTYDWAQAEQFGVPPDMAHRWEIHIGVENHGTATVIQAAFDAIWMGNSNAPTYNCFLFSDFRNPAYNSFAGEMTANNKAGFDYNGFFAESNLGADTAAQTQISYYFPIPGYDTRQIKIAISEMYVASFSGTAHLTIDNYRMDATSYSRADGWNYVFLFLNGHVYYGPGDIVTFSVTPSTDKRCLMMIYLYTGSGSTLNVRLALKWMSSECKDTLTPPQVTLNTPVDDHQTISPSVNFTWNAVVDNGGSGLEKYQLQMASDVTFADNLVTHNDSNTFHVVDSMTTGTYYWRVRGVDKAENVGLWSSVRRFTINTDPTVPVLISPSNGSVVKSNTVSCSWSVGNAGHPNLISNPSFETGNLSGWSGSGTRMVSTEYCYSGMYGVKTSGGMIQQYEGLTRINKTLMLSFAMYSMNVTQPCEVGIEFFEDTPQFRVNMYYYVWQYSHSDDSQNKGWRLGSTPGQYIQTRNVTADLVSKGLSAEHDSIYSFRVYFFTPQLTPIVAYGDAFFLGFGPPYQVASVSYNLQLSQDYQFRSGVLSHNDTHLYHVVGGLTEGAWYWRVRGVGSSNLAFDWTGSMRFLVDFTAPSKPILTYPLNSTTQGYEPTLTWNASTDSVTGVAKYQVQLSNSTGFAYKFVDVNTTNTWCLTPTPLSVQYHYYWRVRAIDNAGNFIWSNINDFYVGDSLLIVWDQHPSSFYQSDGSQTYEFRATFENGTILNTADYTITVDLDGGTDTGNWFRCGTTNTRTINPALESAGVHAFVISLSKTGYTSATASTTFTVLQHQLSILWIKNPTIVYEPQSISFSFYIKDELGNNVTDSSITDKLDGVDGDIAFTWITNRYEANLTSGTLPLTAAKSYLITVDAYKGNYANASTASLTFTVSQFTLGLSWVDDPSSLYQPSNATYSFTVSNGSNNYFGGGDVAVSATLDGTPILFDWNATSTQFEWIADSSLAWATVGQHQVLVSVSRTGFIGANTSKTFTVSQFTLLTSWVDQPSEVQQPNQVTFSLQVGDELNNNYSDASISATLDGSIVIVFTWDGVDKYVWSVSSSTLAAGSHVIVLTVSKPYFANASCVKVFTVAAQGDGGGLPAPTDWSQLIVILVVIVAVSILSVAIYFTKGKHHR